MMVELFVDRAKPRLPYIIPDTNIIIAGIRIESATIGEEPGWSDWTKKNSLFYKFKYTIPKTRDPIRVVFLIPKTRKINLEEFAEKIEETRFFHAVIKWARAPIYRRIETESVDPGKIIYELVKILEPEEVTVLEDELARRGTSLYNFIVELIINNGNPLKATIEKIYNPEERKYRLTLVYEEKLEFYDYGILPFAITITIKRELDHMLVPLNFALHAICSLLKPETTKCRKSTSSERYIDLVEVFSNLINYAEDKLREDHMERINTIIKYYNLMR